MKVFAPISYILRSGFLNVDQVSYLNQLFYLVKLNGRAFRC